MHKRHVLEARNRSQVQVNGFFRGSLLRAGERIFCLGEDGGFAELELSPEGPVTKQRVRLFRAREAWTLPALHRGLLYVAQNSPDIGTSRSTPAIR